MEKGHPTRWAFFMAKRCPHLCFARPVAVPTDKKGPAGPLCYASWY